MPRAKRRSHQVAVIGAGVAGLTAAVEAARCGLKTVLLDDGYLGGLITNVGQVHGHSGPDDLSGADMVNTLLGAALEAGVDYQPLAVAGLMNADGLWRISDAGMTVERVIIATGGQMRLLDVPGEAALTGRGVSQCAYCDGGLYRGKNVAVVGGGDGAFQEALHLAGLCANVAVIMRGERPRARPVFVNQATALDNMHFHWKSEVREILGAADNNGNAGVAGVRLYDHENGAETVLDIDAIFPFIGLAPQTTLAPTAAERDDDGALVVGADMQTNQAGLYAIGAARAGYGGQIAHAMADAKTAAQSVWRASKAR